MSSVSYPNETGDYRVARQELLSAEIALRSQVEDVAKMRRQLPAGGELKEDYVFDEIVGDSVKKTSFAELFLPGTNTLFLYNFMYGPEMNAACPMCTSFVDGLNGQTVHIKQRISLAIVAKNPINKFHQHAATRGWDNLRLLSSDGNSFNTDYFGEVDGHQQSIINVFVKDGLDQGPIRHFWGSEMVFAPAEDGQNMRHVDMMWPLWNVLDVTPVGRGDWYPALSYSQPVTFIGR